MPQPVKQPKGHEKPIRALFSSRNTYRRAIAAWILSWAKWRAEYRRLKKEASKERRRAAA